MCTAKAVIQCVRAVQLHVVSVVEHCGILESVVKMVSFICNVCGQTVRKTQVEKHYQNDCRSCDVLSCIDCGKDFHGDEYVGHTSCITEAEKYQGKLYKPKEKQNKGEHKQQEWLKVIISNLLPKDGELGDLIKGSFREYQGRLKAMHFMYTLPPAEFYTTQYCNHH